MNCGFILLSSYMHKNATKVINNTIQSMFLLSFNKIFCFITDSFPMILAQFRQWGFKILLS